MTTSLHLFLHISAGAIGILSGVLALYFRKGSNPHRLTGNIFFVSMVFMSLSGSYLAYFKPEMISVLNGLLTFYLVATAWLTVKRKPNMVGKTEWVFLILGIIISALLLRNGWLAAQNEIGKIDGFPAAIYYFFGAIAGICVVLDLRMLYFGGIKARHRLVRHLWRMGFALWIATVSFFLGQSQVFPDSIRESKILFLPVLIIMLVMVYWFVRVLFVKKYRN